MGKRRVGEALYATNPSRRMWKGVALKCEAVTARQGEAPWIMRDPGFGAARLMWGTAASLPSLLLKRFPTLSSACRFRDKFVQRSVITLPET